MTCSNAQVSSDGVTVWVNSPTGSIGRFGLRGIDVHTEDTSGCLYCTHQDTTPRDWEVFCYKMAEHHGVVVPQHHMPDRFKTKKKTLGGTHAD